jgi:hypothetical protein
MISDMNRSRLVDEEKRQRNIAENIKASEPVLVDLRQAGFDIELISDLYNKRYDYKNAIPILVKWLPKVENPDIKEAIVRALSVKWAKKTEAPKILVNEFRNTLSRPNLQWAIGNALSVVADDEVLDDVIELIQDKINGKAREMLVVALSNMKTPDVDSFLINLLDEEELAGYAIIALGRLNSKKAYPFIERFLAHQKSWVRKEAKKALKRIS